MSYFLKKAKIKNRTYLAIYDSFFSSEKKHPVNKCASSLFSVEPNYKRHYLHSV
jgi:hypothetical protein